jgi:hypothetical protein
LQAEANYSLGNNYRTLPDNSGAMAGKLPPQSDIKEKLENSEKGAGNFETRFFYAKLFTPEGHADFSLLNTRL